MTLWIAIGLMFMTVLGTVGRWIVHRRNTAVDLRVELGSISEGWLAQHKGMRNHGWDNPSP